MKTSTKAALLSALVFPGAGHLLLKSYAMAAVLAMVTTLGAYELICQAIDIAQIIADKINRGEIALDTERIAAAIEIHITAVQSQSTDVAVYAIAAVWIIGVIDAYRQGVKADNRAAS